MTPREIQWWHAQAFAFHDQNRKRAKP